MNTDKKIRFLNLKCTKTRKKMTHFRPALRTETYLFDYIAHRNNINTPYNVQRMMEHYFLLKIPINSNTTTSFRPEKQPRGTDGSVPAYWRHSGASCSYAWRHIFYFFISVKLLRMVVFINEFSLQSIKATQFDNIFPWTFWSSLVFACFHLRHGLGPK